MDILKKKNHITLDIYTYRIIPNKRAGREDEVGGPFIMCTKMLICISLPVWPRRRH